MKANIEKFIGDILNKVSALTIKELLVYVLGGAIVADLLGFNIGVVSKLTDAVGDIVTDLSTINTGTGLIILVAIVLLAKK